MGRSVATEQIIDRAGTSPRTRLPLQVHLRLARCRNLMMREMRRSVERWNLTMPQFDVLAELARAPEQGFTFVELSRLLLVTSGNLTGIIDRLEEYGLVKRESEATDRRVTRMKLTPLGKRRIDELLPLHAGDVAQVLSLMPRERLALLNDLLGELRDALHAQETPPSRSTPASR
jgi:DNA-binding MarR family transcriptional regulator